MPVRSVPLALLALALALLVRPVHAEAMRAGEFFSGGKGWLNTAEPLTNAQLKGHVVLLDFWTYCCINCMHVMPDLAFLEAKYHDQPLVVVGVHSGKFDHEKDAANIRAAVLRNRIVHPVAVDNDFAIWNRFGVNSWPTFVLIDATGKAVARFSGEGQRERLDQAIAKLLAEGKAAGVLAAKPLRFKPEVDDDAGRALSFPGKVLVDDAGKRLFIADTGHHRILVADPAGAVQRIIGSGAPGLVDGADGAARFNEPQGLALSADGARLYVADRLNHALRAIDLASGVVTTLAGDGQQGHDRTFEGPAKGARLNSPWDLLRIGDRLIIAMAGTHQLWQYTLADQRLAVLAGSGREDCINGDNAVAAYAQPSGLAGGADAVYVADSEVSSIRVLVPEASSGKTRTLAGSADLFGFGAADGTAAAARFQHPLGVALVGGEHPVLWVADTYNHSLRRIDPGTGAVTTLVLTGTDPAGRPMRLREPGGLHAGAAGLVVADTNQHRIVVVDPATGAARVLDVRLPTIGK